ncbi:hypothetical protein CCP4SC76_2310004 [Gammaproteobacteria bacterium]
MAGFLTRPVIGLRASKSALTGKPSGGRITKIPLYGGIDAIYGGRYQISGYVNENGINGVYRVRLYLRDNGMKLRETWSAADGSYSFDNIAYREGGYFLVSRNGYILPGISRAK